MTGPSRFHGALLAAALSLCAILPAPGQSPALTLGGQFVGFRYMLDSGPSLFASCDCFAMGLGLRFTAHLAGRIGVDGALNFLPPQGGIPGQRDWAAEVLLGPRFRLAGGSRAALFIAIRPGWISLHRAGPFCCMPTPVNPPATSPITVHSGVVDIGGTLEFALPRSWLLRFDLGAMYLRPILPGGITNTDIRIATGLAYRF